MKPDTGDSRLGHEVKPEATATLPQPRKLVQEMPEYHPPLAGRQALRLDFNENTLAPSPRVAA